MSKIKDAICRGLYCFECGKGIIGTPPDPPYQRMCDACSKIDKHKQAVIDLIDDIIEKDQKKRWNVLKGTAV